RPCVHLAHHRSHPVHITSPHIHLLVVTGRLEVPARHGALALPLGLADFEEGSHGRSTCTISPHRASAPASGAALAGPARPCSLTRMAKSWLPLVAWALLCGGATVLAAQQDGGGRAGLERPLALPIGERRAVQR